MTLPYMFSPNAIIRLTRKCAQEKMRGTRGKYLAILRKCEGKQVEDFAKKCERESLTAANARDKIPHTWLQFFVERGLIELDCEIQDAVTVKRNPH